MIDEIKRLAYDLVPLAKRKRVWAMLLVAACTAISGSPGACFTLGMGGDA